MNHLQVREQGLLTGELLPAEREGLLIELQDPLRRLLLDPARSIGRDDIEVVSVTEVPRGPIVHRTENGSWFFASDFLEDPGLARDGGIAIPEAELQKLRALRDAGRLQQVLLLAAWDMQQAEAAARALEAETENLSADARS